MMQRNNRWLGYARRIVMLSIAALQFSACEKKPEPPPAQQLDPTVAEMAEYTGTAIHRVRLTEKRAAELGIETVAVREEQTSEGMRKVVPAISVLRDQYGNSWAFKNPAPLVFIRERVSVDTLAGEWVFLAEGPPAGTLVVTTGAAGLFLNEYGENRVGAAEGETTESGKEKKHSGVATMKEDGTLSVVYKAEGSTGFTASIVVNYKPTDEEYQKILDQIGGLQVGESKAVPSLADQLQ